KQVWVATWSADELSTDLRVRCFGQLRLSEGIGAFRAERARVHGAERGYGTERATGAARPLSVAPRISRPVVGLLTAERALVELQRAEARLPHVSRGYFVTRWKSHQLPPAGQEREQLV